MRFELPVLHITLPNDPSNHLDPLVSEYCNRYFQNVLPTPQAKLQANVSATWTTDKNGNLGMIPVITNQTASRACLREYDRSMIIEQIFLRR